LFELIDALGHSRRRLDAVAFTDGSGTVKGMPGGYAALLIDFRKADPVLLTGVSSNATSQAAEVRAVWELNNYLTDQNVGLRPNGYRILLVTDNKYVAAAMAKISKDPLEAFAMKHHRALWTSIQYSRRVGVITNTAYVGRCANPLMKLVDEASRSMRLGLPDKDLDGLFSTCMKECKDSFRLGG
jgi:ribonuclease HI